MSYVFYVSDTMAEIMKKEVDVKESEIISTGEDTCFVTSFGLFSLKNDVKVPTGNMKKNQRDWKNRRPAYCLGSAESPAADFSLVWLMRYLLVAEVLAGGLGTCW